MDLAEGLPEGDREGGALLPGPRAGRPLHGGGISLENIPLPGNVIGENARLQEWPGGLGDSTEAWST